MEKAHFLVQRGESRQRLDRFLAGKLPNLSRAAVQRLIASGMVTRNGHPAAQDDSLAAGDQIEAVLIDEPKFSELVPEDIPLSILHEDSDLIVINKPAGLVVHPGAGNWKGTMVHALLHHATELSAEGGRNRPGIVHRLDKETSGCLVVAKNDSTHRKLAAQFASRETTKMYLAVVEGRPRLSEGRIDAPIGRHPIHRKTMTISVSGRPALTSYRLLAEERGRSLLECTLHTGRTHQIRVHLKHLGCPVSGDLVYGRRGETKRHLLHAWKLGFWHPGTGKRLLFEAPPPAEFCLGTFFPLPSAPNVTL